jgi:preprotein translocase subunit SecY
LAANPNTVGKGGKFGDLKRRLWFLLGALVVYRIGAHIPVPGIDPNVLSDLFNSQQGGILGMFNMFSGGALVAIHDFRIGDHAVHLGIDHHAVDERCQPAT